MTRRGTGPDYTLEAASPGPVCGVDEAGRGPWAGPVSAAAVILDPTHIPEGLNDSKALSERRRDALEIEIKAAALAWGVGFASVEEIDGMNILQATGLAMRRAVEALAIPPACILVDGSWRFDLPAQVRPVVKGDSLSVSIAAASILAKTARDRVMVELDRDWPDYGFAAHKGYHAPRHVEALRRLGPCPAHRRSFAPIRALLNPAD
ncbi:MAG: ribonuclease HII [Phenylobacterium sp.]|uniref:ribonuclease HII n=1 Tax=Phenylobacterium sp. TaxID=1871053 RepID=UPI0025F15782|nr:ribonuclease HII [Phenylobacterium sp.]MCA3737104.1 ribonuclease HII [Phenylobacterium sp.]MCA4917127.1 ribonuclease HII [Phenylobacterium sp.]MCA6255019.1 ribonuclease HII [Phenylobacterium sp.]